MALELTSPAFGDNEKIPSKYTCQGDDINPALEIKNTPPETKTLCLIMDDPDAPVGSWNHWIIFDFRPTDQILEDSVPEGGMQGKNSWGRPDYGGPCPPSGTHRYVFKLYALNTQLNLEEGSRKRDIEDAMKGHIIEEAKLTGLYEKE